MKAGLNRDAITYRLEVGRLHRLYRNVYAVGHVPPSPASRAMAAVLTCGEGAVLSHRSAAAMWGFGPRWRGPVEVTADERHRHRGVRMHLSRTLTARDVTTHFGIPITRPARTLVDLADALDDRALARSVNEAQVQHRVSLDVLAAQLARSPGRRGVGRLRRFVELADAPTRSDLEDAFLAFTERHGLPRPEVNETVAGYEVDVLWRAHRLIVELDSRQFHDYDQPFERDRDKDAALLAAGFPVVRVTWTRMRDWPDREAERLRRLLAQRSPG